MTAWIHLSGKKISNYQSVEKVRRNCSTEAMQSLYSLQMFPSVFYNGYMPIDAVCLFGLAIKALDPLFGRNTYTTRHIGLSGPSNANSLLVTVSI